MEQPCRGDHPAHIPAGALFRAVAAVAARSAPVRKCDRPGFSGHHQAAALRRRKGAVRERARPAALPVQSFAVRHLARRHHVRHQPDGLRDPRIRPGERLSALPGRVVQPGARSHGDVRICWRAIPAAGRDRPNLDRGRQGGGNCAEGRTHGAGKTVRRLYSRRASDVRQAGRTRAASRGFFEEDRCVPIYEMVAVRTASGDERTGETDRRSVRPEHPRTLKWSLGAETMEDLVAAHADVMAGRVPKIVQFGAGPLSVLDPTQAPPGKHTQYAWHVMPLNPDIGGRDYESFKEEFADRIIETFAR